MSAIRQAMLNRADVLTSTAEANASSVSEESVSILRKKAKEHAEKLQLWQDLLKFAEILEQVTEVLDKFNAKLAENMSYNSEDECEGWVLGSFGISMVDISLGVILNKLSLLGLGYMFWSFHKRPFIRKFFKQISQRPAFIKAVNQIGRVDPPSIDLTAEADGNVGRRVPSDESIEILNVLLRSERNPDERTWQDLWR